jgi:hypothetical protein
MVTNKLTQPFVNRRSCQNPRQNADELRWLTCLGRESEDEIV